MRGVVHRKPTTASATDEKPDQQGSAATTGLGAVSAAIGVGGELLLVALELRPINVSLVVSSQENLAVLQTAIMAISLAGTAIDDLSAMLARP